MPVHCACSVPSPSPKSEVRTVTAQRVEFPGARVPQYPGNNANSRYVRNNKFKKKSQNGADAARRLLADSVQF
eukprot:1892976-Rhodomonas_salina.1